MRASSFLFILLITLCVGFAACKQSGNEPASTEGNTETGQVTEEVESATEEGKEDVEKAAEDVVDKTQEMHNEQVAQLKEKAPAEIAAELWNLIQTEEYKIHWKEQKSGLFYSKEDDTTKKPVLLTYMNPTAVSAIESKTQPLPPGSIIVKERYDEQEQLKTITAMINLGGNKPEDINWFSAQYSPDGKVLHTNVMGEGVSSQQ